MRHQKEEWKDYTINKKFLVKPYVRVDFEYEGRKEHYHRNNVTRSKIRTSSIYSVKAYVENNSMYEQLQKINTFTRNIMEVFIEKIIDVKTGMIKVFLSGNSGELLCIVDGNSIGRVNESADKGVSYRYSDEGHVRQSNESQIKEVEQLNYKVLWVW